MPMAIQPTPVEQEWFDLLHLPKIGIRGNTHFLFPDLNNLEIADLMYKFLEKEGLN